MENNTNTNNQGCSYHSILKYTGLFGGVQVINILVSLVRNKLVAVILGPNGFGFISLLNSTIKVLSDSTNFGIPFSAVRQVSDFYEQKDEAKVRHYIKVVRCWSLLVACLGAFLCVVMAPLLNDWTFNWGDHTKHFMMLAPVVFFTAIIGGELAILKGTRRLRVLAQISVINVVMALFISIPLFYYYGQKGIVPSMNLVALASFVVTAAFSYRFYPVVRSNEKFFADGMEMIKIGIFFTLAGIGGSCAEMIIKTYLNNAASLDIVGLYNAGYMICVTYAGMVFAAMETDYFPRLSAVHRDIERMNMTINHQIEVSLLIVGPMLVALVIFLPIVIPILFSGKFVEVVPMAQIAILAMFLHAVDLPVEYLPLAKGDSVTYLTVELIYDVVFVFLLIFGYQQWGLVGTGIALLVAHVLNCVGIVIYYSWRYKVRLSRRVGLIFSLLTTLGALAYAFTLCLSGVAYWMLGSLLLVVSVILAVALFKRYNK
ncbi:MAG: oligosaccharide flippase family protein [Prevotellaceae bacterium]|nr:oligosaccharide flippase family protein [Prevotellaceae bacterium]